MNITVYLGSSFGNDPAYKEAAEEVGRWIARRGHRLIYGGSGVGLMGVLADTVLAGGGEVIGVEPRFFLDAGLEHTGITKTIPTDTMAERRTIMLEMGSAYIALPGGSGTLDEISEAIVLAGLGKHEKPCILYNKIGFYDPLLEVYDRMRAAGFLKESVRERILCASSPEDLDRILCVSDPKAPDRIF